MRTDLRRFFTAAAVAVVSMHPFSGASAADSTKSAPAAPMRKPAELIQKQAPGKIYKDVYNSLTQDNSHVIVSLTLQRVWLMNGDAVALDSPISSGKRAGMTPTGQFNVKEKDPDHPNARYGKTPRRSALVRALS